MLSSMNRSLPTASSHRKRLAVALPVLIGGVFLLAMLAVAVFDVSCCPCGREAPAAGGKVDLMQLEEYQGQPSWRIETPAATYVYHRDGAGFASLIDPDGKDWISFRTTGGSDGPYRGIPNIIHPEGGFHPGKDTCISRIVREDQSGVTIESRTKDGRWACRWEIGPRTATVTIEKIGHPYWVLYEGTPGGAYDETKAFMVDSAGNRTPCTERWERRLPDPRWIYFGTPDSNYVLFLIDRTERKADTVDSFWSMQKNMTVFGFGRVLNSRDPRWKHLTETPARVTVGLLPAAEHDRLAETLNALAVLK